MKENFLSMRTAQQQDRLPRNSVQTPSMEIFKTRRNQVPSNQDYPRAGSVGGWTGDLLSFHPAGIILSVLTEKRRLDHAVITGGNCLTSFMMEGSIKTPLEPELNRSTKLKVWIYINALVQSIAVLN